MKRWQTEFNYLRELFTNPNPNLCIRLDETPASRPLSKCSIINELAITIEIGRTKTPNKFLVVD